MKKVLDLIVWSFERVIRARRRTAQEMDEMGG